MKFKNYEIESFMEFIFNMKLKGKASRMRTRLIGQLNEYTENILNPERDELINQYAKKDDKGEIVLAADGKGTELIEDTIPEFNIEFEALMNEEFTIDEVESNKDILVSVGLSLLDCEIEVSGRQAILFDEWCEKFEEVIERYKEE